MKPRERTLARMKHLAAAGVVAGCHGSGYGVVDPMPPPACFETPQPVVTARLVEPMAADGTRLVELLVKFQQRDAKVGEMQAQVIGGAPVEITKHEIGEGELRAVFRVPKGMRSVYFTAQVACAHGTGFTASLEVDDTTASVTYVH